MSALLQSIRDHASSGRTNPAFEDGTRRLSWAEASEAIDQAVEQIIGMFGERRPVGLSLDNSIASALLLIAMAEAEVPIVPLPPFFNEALKNAALDNAGAFALIDQCSLEGGLVRFTVRLRQSAGAPLPDSTALISFSSGSTGTPKGVCLSADHLIAIASAVCDFLGRDTAGRHLAVLPFGILLEQVAGLFASILAGGTYLPFASSDVGLTDPLRPDGARLLKTVARERVTSLILAPEYLAALVAAMEESSLRLPRLNLVAVGGASTPAPLLARAAAVGLPVRQGYGMTEAGSVITLEDGKRPS